jgi:hypothetical protein
MRSFCCGLVCLVLGLPAPTFAQGPPKAFGAVETNRVVVGPWEKVRIEGWGDEVIAIHFETGYLSAEGDGGGNAIANRPAANLWEKWTLIRNTDGTFSFLASDGQHVLTAEPPSAPFPAGRLRVDRRQIGVWEKFLIDTHDDVTALRSLATGYYLSAQETPHPR